MILRPQEALGELPDRDLSALSLTLQPLLAKRLQDRIRRFQFRRALQKSAQPLARDLNPGDSGSAKAAFARCSSRIRLSIAIATSMLVTNHGLIE